MMCFRTRFHIMSRQGKLFKALATQQPVHWDTIDQRVLCYVSSPVEEGVIVKVFQLEIL